MFGKQFLLPLIALFYLPLLLACNGQVEPGNETPAEPEIKEPWIALSQERLDFSAYGGSQSVAISYASGLDPNDLSIKVSDEGEDWCTASVVGNNLTVTVERFYMVQDRYTSVRIAFDDRHKVTLTIHQDKASDTEDHRIKVMDGTPLDGMDEDHLLKASYDGDKSTFFNSPVGAVTYPYIITYRLEPGHTLNRIVYTPRTDSGNKWGSFDRFVVEASTQEAPDRFTMLGTFQRGDGVHTPFTMGGLEVPNVHTVKFTILQSYQDRVSCAEMEFFENASDKFNPLDLFEDKACTRLKPEATRRQIMQIPYEPLRKAALEMLSGSYDSEWRLRTYRPWQDPALMAFANKTGKYSLRDNPTGIYALPGEKMIVAVDKVYPGGSISLMIQDLTGGYGNTQSFPLQEGINEILAPVGGLIYVDNHTAEDLPLLVSDATAGQKTLLESRSVTIHFVSGHQQGYFDVQEHSAEDWERILAAAPYQDIDVLGRYIHVTWRVSDFKLYRTDILLAVQDLDTLVWSEWEFMGLIKYGRTFRNRVHACIDYVASSPNASDYRTVYTPGYANAFCSHDTFLKRLWVQSHEIGHVNQTRPGMKWAGMTEVTNNIYCLYVQTVFGITPKLQADGIKGSDVNPSENWYCNARDSIILTARPHCEPNQGRSIMRELQLVPFWQLKLYIENVLGQTDFYKDLFEHYRTTPDLDSKQLTEGIMQLDFVRQVCRISGLNLLDFFRKWGFLSPVDTILNDYGNKNFRITSEQITAIEAEINAASYPKPAADVTLITDSNYQTFNNSLI